MSMEHFPPLMFLGLILIMLNGFPVAFSLATLGLGRLLADPACRLAELQDFLKGVGQQLDEVN